MKKYILIILGIFMITLSSCKSNNDIVDQQPCQDGYVLKNDQCVTDNPVVPTKDLKIGTVSGLEDMSTTVDHYFNPIKNVLALNDSNEDITHLFEVTGHVNYGVLGSYELVYSLEYGDDTYSKTRTVTVTDDVFVGPTGSRPQSTTGVQILGDGSYYTGANTNIDHPVNSNFIANDLLDYAIPSSGWWTTLLVQNYGGGNGLYTNPLRFAYSNQGMEITNPEDGFVQYWNDGINQTMAQFPLALKDGFLKTDTLNEGYETVVIDYGDNHVKVAMRNVSDDKDHMVTTLVQGSPYVFVETMDQSSLTYTFDVNGVDNYEYFDLEGNLITSDTHTSDGIIIKMVHRHSGYDTSLPANVGSPQYSDKYYLVNTPDNTTFTITSNNHPFNLKNSLNISLGDSNYLSIAAINDLSEAAFYHTRGYAFIHGTNTTFSIDDLNSTVTTNYQVVTSKVNENMLEDGVLLLMPHQYKNSNATLTEYNFRTVRGTLKAMTGNRFKTTLSFRGLLPGFTMPNNSEFSINTAATYLNDLNNRININDMESFINDEGPYWNSKAIYPLAQGIIIADQIGNNTLKTSFITKLRYVLDDWFTYNSPTDEKFLYYNNHWGSVYYSNDDFGTATSLSDHSFTHGYLIYASSVLAMYDEDFKTSYKDMVNLLLDDYMYPVKGQSDFAYLRNFDTWAGHSWAHGFGTFAEGNNLESTSEALNSWVGGYLWALATNDEARREVAIYGFVTELSAIKEYWFDYDETNWDPDYGDYVDVAGLVWGGKHDYATWFGANPTFIYGIQWLPTGEYLTNYALDQSEYDKLSSIFATYLDAKNGNIDTWYSNMWSIQSIINPDQALSNFNASLIQNDDYPNELIGSYWMINAMASLGQRTSEVWMEIHPSVAATIYENDSGQTVAMIWNVSTSSQTVDFYNVDGLLISKTVEASSFTEVIVD